MMLGHTTGGVEDRDRDRLWWQYGVPLMHRVDACIEPWEVLGIRFTQCEFD